MNSLYLPEELQRLIQEFARPCTRPDWRQGSAVKRNLGKREFVRLARRDKYGTIIYSNSIPPTPYGDVRCKKGIFIWPADWEYSLGRGEESITKYGYSVDADVNTKYRVRDERIFGKRPTFYWGAE